MDRSKSKDARFEDVDERPLYLGASDKEDVQVLSALLQDAVFPLSELKWQSKQRRLLMLVNRYRHEHQPSGAGVQVPERVQSLFVVNTVKRVASQGFDKKESDLVLSVLQIEVQEMPDGDLSFLITLAGDGALRIDVELIDISLKDVTRPYIAPAGRAPQHPE